MRLTVERMPESQVLLDIAADDDEFAQAMEKAARKVSRQVNIPGFRPGKAPRHIVESMFGREIFIDEANRSMMDDLYRQALKQEELVPVGEPEVEIVEAEPLNFKVTVPVFPTVEPGTYADVRVEPKDAAIEENAVDEVIERLQKAQSPWVDPAEPRTPRDGDQITIDLAVTEGDESFQDPVEDAVFVLGESGLFDQLQDAIKELAVGETTTVELAFEDEDENVNERLRGKALSYTITLKGVKQRDLLPLDDEFAKAAADTESLNDLRKAIADDLHRAKTNEVRSEVLNEIINSMADTATIELPAPMIDDAVEEELNNLRLRLTQQRSSIEEYLRVNNQTEEELKEELRPTLTRRVRNSLLMREIAKREGIDVGDADVDAEIDDITSGAENAEQLRELYRKEGYFRGMLRNDLFDRRLTDRLIEIATDGRGATLNGWTAPETEGGEAGRREGEEDLDAVAVDSGQQTSGDAEEADAETAAAAAAAAEATQS